MGEDEGTEDAVDDNEGSEANMGEEMGAENLDAVLGLNSSIGYYLCWGGQANNTNLGKCTSFLFFIFNRYAFSAIRISIKMTHFSEYAKQKCF